MNYIYIPISLTVIGGYYIIRILFKKPRIRSSSLIGGAMDMMVDGAVCLFKLLVAIIILLVMWMVYFAILDLTN